VLQNELKRQSTRIVLVASAIVAPLVRCDAASAGFHRILLCCERSALNRSRRLPSNPTFRSTFRLGADMLRDYL
jgi:hypothetical protein